LTNVNWDQLPKLGDEQEARKRVDGDGKRKSAAARLEDFQTAVRANRQLSVALCGQGLNEHADRFAYHAQLMQHIVLRRKHHYLRWLGSLLLGLISGYGYRPLRSVATYVLVILAFASAYLLNAQFASPHLRWDEALVLSISAFHGRGFFTSGIPSATPWLGLQQGKLSSASSSKLRSSPPSPNASLRGKQPA
jgi:hypothetical protein